MHKQFDDQDTADNPGVTSNPSRADGSSARRVRSNARRNSNLTGLPSAESAAGLKAMGAVPRAAPTPRALGAVRAALRGIHWGRDPHDVSPPDPAHWAPYNPQYIIILYLRLEANWEMTVNHAAFVPTTNTQNGRLAQAVDILTEKIGNNWELGDPRLHHHGIYEHIWDAPIAGHQVGHKFDSVAFTDFNFYSQNELFIFLHDDDIMLEDGDLIGFKANSTTSPKPKDFNFSYFHARAVPVGDLGTLASEGRMIRVENYATKEDGTLIGAENRNYSMDIKFRIDGGSAGTIIMIIDPDTGNGAGSEP
jgi:hypothetical protein